MDVTIREARPEDVPTLTILRQQALEAAYRDTYDPTEVADIVARVGDLRSWIGADAVTVLVVETEVTAVGYGALDHEAGELTALYTSPDYQREGFGSELLARLEQRVPEDAAVEAATPEHAVGFFEREGYAVGEDTRWHDLPAVTVRKLR